MKTKTIVASAMMLLAIGTAAAQETQAVGQPAAAETTIKIQTACPIMGGQVNTNIYVDANGKRIYFCCAGCPAEFKKDPAKYITKMKEDGITLDNTPTVDPAKKPAADAAVVPSPAPAAKGCRAGGCCN